jgi:O-antigen ligase
LLLVGWMLLRCLVSERRLRLLVELIMAIAVLSAIFGLWRQLSQHQVGFVLPKLRPGFGYGQFINSNHFAFLMEMALGLTLGMAICRGVSGVRLAIYVLCAVPMFVTLVLANSRGGILSILCQAVFLAWLLVSRRGQNKGSGTVVSGTRLLLLRAVLVTMLLVGAVVTVVFVGGDPLVGRIDTISVELDPKAAHTFALRQNIWQATWRLIKDHPVAGVGFGGYWIAITKYHQASGDITPQEAHNDYLELLASGGVIGVLIGIWFIVEFARSARRTFGTADHFHRAVALGAMAGILAVAVHSLVDFGLHTTINALVFTVLIAVSTGQTGGGRRPHTFRRQKTARV